MSWPRTSDNGSKTDADNFISGTVGAPVSFNLTAAILTALEAVRDNYADALAVAQNPDTRTKGTIIQKNTLKKSMLDQLRSAGRLVQAGPNVTDQQKADIGLPIRDKNPTSQNPPDTYPLSTLIPQGAARNQLRLADSATPTRRARAKGAVAAEVRMAIVASGQPIPSGDTGWTKTTFVTKAINEVESDENDAGKTLVVQSRWLGSKGQTGPWGPIETGTIAA